MQSTAQTFGQVNFGTVRLGDKRRNQRLVELVDAMVRRPGGTLPDKLHNPKDLKAFYRLMNRKEVTHEAVLAPHREATLKKIDELDKTVLVLHDATELDFTKHKSVAEELGQIGNGHHRGYIAQNALAVDPQGRQVLGLLNQVLHHRVKVRKNESPAQKRERETRESRLWLRGTEPIPGDWRLVDVCDQGADTFEFLEHEVHSGRRFVIRTAYDRGVIVGHDDCVEEHSNLRTYMVGLPMVGTWTLTVTSRDIVDRPKRKGKKKLVKRIAREANMAVSFAPIQIKPPKSKRGKHGNQPLKMWAIRVWEIDPPPGQERLEWYLVTNEPIHNFEDAYRVVGWYETRWVVEEFHKGMKTGCNIESPQFTCESRLQPAIALISVVAITLLNMRDASRRPDARTRKATEIISEDYVEVLSIWRHGESRIDWSIHDFFYALARLGGHQNRKNDHPPGWLVIWRGWGDLQAMVTGAHAIKKSKKRCG